jgi:hypothetical protein
MSDPTRRPSMMETVQTTDGFLRHAGRDFLVVLYTVFRSLKLYPIENAQVQKALDDLAATTKHLLDVEREIEIRLQGEFIFVNSTRLRLDLDNYASFSHILNVFSQCGIGAVRLDEGVDRKQLQIFVSLLLAYAAKDANPNKLFELGQKLVDGGVSFIAVDPPLESEEDVEEEERQKEAAKRTYARSVAVTKEVINSIRMGRTANVKKVKRAVQAIVDQVLNNESSLVGLTTLRDYDEYTFTHSVNVCIFSVALGRKLGLTKLQLYDLGMAALFHDVGKSRVPLEVLNKEGGLTDEEWRIMQAHPWLGVLTLFGLRGYGEIPYRGMVVAYEHHMKTDLTGYPKSIRPRELSIYSKIISVSDGPDPARPGPEGDVGEPAPRVRPGGREGVHQSDRHLPRRYVRHPRHVRSGDRAHREPRRDPRPPPRGADRDDARRGAAHARHHRRPRPQGGGRHVSAYHRQGHRPAQVRHHGQRLLCLSIRSPRSGGRSAGGEGDGRSSPTSPRGSRRPPSPATCCGLWRPRAPTSSRSACRSPIPWPTVRRSSAPRKPPWSRG